MLINPLFSCNPQFSAFAFADDSTFVISLDRNKLEAGIRSINIGLSRIAEWFNNAKLSLNAGKSQAVIFHTRQTKIDLATIEIKINNQIIPMRKEIKCLGLTLDQHLSWIPQVNALMPKCQMAIGAIKKLRRNNIPLNVIKMVYNALFLSHIIYCLPVWGKCGVVTTQKLQVLQNKAIRAVFGMNQGSSIRSTMSNHQMMNIEGLIKYYTGIFAFKHIKGYYQPEASFTYNPLPNRQRRLENTFQKPMVRLELTRNQIYYQVANVWLGLDRNLQALDNLLSFKKKLKIIILEEQLMNGEET